VAPSVNTKFSQARSQVSRFGGGNVFIRGQDFFLLQSDLVYPSSEKPQSPLSDTTGGNGFLPMHFTPLIQKPRCPTPTGKLGTDMSNQ